VTAFRHNVKIVAGASTIEGWQSYDITHDMLNPADSFSLSAGPYTQAKANALRPDTRVRIYVDDVLQLDGFTGQRRAGVSRRGGGVLTVSGRDRGGRLVDESAPIVSFAGLGIADLALKMATPWVERVELSNASNRRLIAGGAKVKTGRVSAEPAIDRSPRAERKVRPGETRWQVLQHFLQEGKLLAWLSADGAALVVGKPNYDQEPTFRFVEAPVGSQNRHRANFESIEVSDSVEELYSRITCSATWHESYFTANAAGNAVTFEETHRYRGVANDGPGADGIGNRFQYPKTCVLVDQDVRSSAAARTRAEREMADLGSDAHALTITVKGHGQLAAGAVKPTLFACDTMARVRSETLGIDGDYLITRVRFTADKPGGEVTELALVPKGVELSA
jgi:prophage tail gpP-like protein